MNVNLCAKENRESIMYIFFITRCLLAIAHARLSLRNEVNVYIHMLIAS